jgi:hypothetical protein
MWNPKEKQKRGELVSDSSILPKVMLFLGRQLKMMDYLKSLFSLKEADGQRFSVGLIFTQLTDCIL